MTRRGGSTPPETRLSLMALSENDRAKLDRLGIENVKPRSRPARSGSTTNPCARQSRAESTEAGGARPAIGGQALLTKDEARRIAAILSTGLCTGSASWRFSGRGRISRTC